ncbi:hypothetical protein G3N57_32460, partial [Paraburkholderia sp. Se-20369]|nr:hypothetical protein [Paraburkholderia sp. Se-20369]
MTSPPRKDQLGLRRPTIPVAYPRLLLSLRLGPLFVFAPPFAQLRVPLRIRVCLVLALAGAFAAPV